MSKEVVVATPSTEIYANQVKLFGKWNCDEVNVEDISLRVTTKLFFRRKKKRKLSNFVSIFNDSPRITYQSKVRRPNIYHTRLAVIKSSDFTRLSAQLSSVWPARSWCTAETTARSSWLFVLSNTLSKLFICLLERWHFHIHYNSFSHFIIISF